MRTTMYFSVGEWNNEMLFMAFVYAWISLDMLLTVSCLPISMRLCDPRVAATQCTIYMAISNFGISIGAFALSRVDSFGGLPSIVLVVGVGMAVALLLFARYPRRPEFYAALAANAAQLPHDDRLKPRID